MHYFLVTTYNHAAFITDAFQSIRRQYGSDADFKRAARVIILDDASTDNTSEILADLQLKHFNVEVLINPKNRGIGTNRNLMLNWWASREPAEDDFLLFVDGDDILPPGCLETKLRAFDRDPCLEVVGGQLSLFYGQNMADLHPVPTFPVDPEMQAIANIFECHFYVSNALFRASVFLDPSVRFPETPTSEDWLFFSLHRLRKLHVPDVTLKYRRHAHNLTTRPLQPQEIFQLRRKARTLSLLRIGMMPTDRECQLLDLVGYLSFRLKWFGTGYNYLPKVSMPWFGLLAANKTMHARWPETLGELEAFFQRIREHNDRAPNFNHVKLRAYLDAILDAAKLEMAPVIGSATLAPAESRVIPIAQG